MRNLNLWNYLTLQSGDFLNQLVIKNFAQPTIGGIEWSIEIKKKRFTILFFDIKKSTQLLVNNREQTLKEIFEFLGKVLRIISSIWEYNFEYKLVGDDILILEPSEKYFTDLCIVFSRAINSYLDFRLVGGIGELHCIEFKTRNGNLKECIGFSISCLVKLSKQVEDYKWFGEFIPKNCKKFYREV